MFEQATLTNGPAGKRFWTTFVGLTSQIALVSFAMLIPMLWPQVLPTARFLESLAPPMPPAPRQLGEAKRIPASARVLKPLPWSLVKYQPASVPTRVYTLVEEPAGVGVVGLPAGLVGSDTGIVGAFPQIMDTVRLAPPRIPEPVATPAAPEPAPAIPRYKVGGDVRLGAVLHKAEPQYPPLAKAARVAGSVSLECVVGVDGHIHEVKVTSGNALLVRAAVDAAWQWVYAPSKLNGVPIEVVTILTFTFKLN
jgi:protein TonB